MKSHNIISRCHPGMLDNIGGVVKCARYSAIVLRRLRSNAPGRTSAIQDSSSGFLEASQCTQQALMLWCCGRSEASLPNPNRPSSLSQRQCIRMQAMIQQAAADNCPSASHFHVDLPLATSQLIRHGRTKPNFDKRLAAHPGSHLSESSI